MVKLSYLTVIRFRGDDAGSFLHAQLSADVLALAAGESTFACYCEPKGRVLALLLVYRNDDGYYVIMSGALATAVTDRLKIYRMRDRVDIEVMNGYTVSGLQADEPPEPVLESAHAIQLAGSDRWLVLTSAEDGPETDEQSQEEWKVAELHLGITWLSPQTSGEFLPQMLGFEELGAVNYRKGCYPGQEIVARTHYLGKVKRHPRLLGCQLALRPEPMDKVDIISDGQAYDAIIADCGLGRDGKACLLVITRMEPEMVAQRIEFGDETADVSQS